MYKDEILNLKKKAVNYNNNLNNINFKELEEKENLSFNKVMHKKSMFDEGSKKLAIKGRKTPVIERLKQDEDVR